MAIPIALQLYSVRADCEKDLAAVLDAVAEMGYEGVEFAGYYDRGAEGLRQMLDVRGLVCCGTHTRIDTLLGDALAETIAFNKTLGNPYLIVPGLAEEWRSSRRAWLETADLFNDLAEQVAPEDMKVGYHNHTVEFTEMDGELPWDTFFGNTLPEVIMQLDVGNAAHGGGDAPTLLKKYPGRATTVHLKPHCATNPHALIGEDDLPWQEIFDLCAGVGGTEWYIVECEESGAAALEAVEKCLRALRDMGQ